MNLDTFRSRTSWEEEELSTHSIVTCDDESSVAADKPVAYGEGMRASVTFFLGWGG